MTAATVAAVKATATAKVAATNEEKRRRKKKNLNEEKKNISYLPGVVALAAVAVAFGVELSGLHKSTHVFVVYIQRYIYKGTHTQQPYTMMR